MLKSYILFSISIEIIFSDNLKTSTILVKYSLTNNVCLFLFKFHLNQCLLGQVLNDKDQCIPN